MKKGNFGVLSKIGWSRLICNIVFLEIFTSSVEDSEINTITNPIIIKKRTTMIRKVPNIEANMNLKKSFMGIDF